METRNKSMVTYSLDREVLEAFEKFCATGERSSTINELLKDYLQKQGKFGDQSLGLKTEKEILAKRMADIQSKQDELEAANQKLLAQREAEIQARARKMELQKIKDDRMFKARQLTYAAFGLAQDTPMAQLDEMTKALFAKRLREYYQRLEKGEI